MPVRYESGSVTEIVSSIDGAWEKLITTEWAKTFIVLPKKSVTGSNIRACSVVYRRYREAFSKGQRILNIDYITPAEYTMAVLKGDM